MKKFFRYVMCLALLLLVATAVTAGRRNTSVKPVYIFGFASSFTDSLAFMTDVQLLDSAYILPHGVLANRSLYSIQLYGFVNENKGVQNPTAAVFFSENVKEITQKHEKLKRMYLKGGNVNLYMLKRDEFRFTPEAYEEEVVTEIPQ